MLYIQQSAESQPALSYNQQLITSMLQGSTHRKLVRKQRHLLHSLENVSTLPVQLYRGACVRACVSVCLSLSVCLSVCVCIHVSRGLVNAYKFLYCFILIKYLYLICISDWFKNIQIMYTVYSIELNTYFFTWRNKYFSSNR